MTRAAQNTNGRPTQDPRLVRTDADIRAAVHLWCSDRAAAERKYGHISQWDTSEVTITKENCFQILRISSTIAMERYQSMECRQCDQDE